MSKIIQNLEISINEDLDEKLSWMFPNHGPYRVLRKSVDARRRGLPHFVYSVEIADNGESLQSVQINLEKINQKPKSRPIIIGSGPAGLFTALRLVERGIPCTLLERGSTAEKRILGINRYWRYGKMDPNNNVCFGEGGAGLYSDGKLITRIKSPHIPYVLNRLVQFGAPSEIEYLANPHVGSDKIRRLIPKIREFLLSHNCDIHFDTTFSELITENSHVVGVRTQNGKTFYSPHVVLATGHSAEDVLLQLFNQGVSLEGKSFAMGLRIEHPQSDINKIQFREFSEHEKLGSANYRLAHHNHQTDIGVYSFCMCPGGFVLSSGTEENRIVCNGMSNYKRNSIFANSAIVVSIDHDRNFPNELFGGLNLRRNLESRAYESIHQQGGHKELPAQNLLDFMNAKNSIKLQKGSSPSGALPSPLHEILPKNIYSSLMQGLEKFENQMRGFVTNKAQLYGVESRTSCPIRVIRDKVSLQSPTHPGLFPAGEGAGYAGGITSAACDGVKIADKIYELLIKP